MIIAAAAVSRNKLIRAVTCCQLPGGVPGLARVTPRRRARSAPRWHPRRLRLRADMRRQRGLLRQMMYRRIMLACSVRLAWPVPSSVKYRNAVNCASTRFNQN
jgi:hypothetical protein